MDHASAPALPTTAAVSRKVIGLVGAGNIGSRHLQGLARSRLGLDIHVVEPADSARKLAADRVAAIAPGKNLTYSFHADLSQLPEVLDVLLLTTGAGPRRMLTEVLFDRHKIGAVVFEKFLFQKINDIKEIGSLLEVRGVPAWVNTPRRYWPSYRTLAGELETSGPITMIVSHDAQHGLATNLIHLLDLLAFLVGSERRYQLSGRELRLDTNISRHAGMVEFSGHVYGYSDQGDVLVVRPAREGHSNGRIEILADNTYIIIDEAQQTMTRLDQSGTLIKRRFEPIFQSNLTHRIVEDILLQKTCMLPDYATSAQLHTECLRAFLEAMGLSRDAADTNCPVT